MIMMRSSVVSTKMGKPPPPVPPRPSKTLVAEALAKTTRKVNNNPIRMAPAVPGDQQNNVSKSKSCVSVNVTLKKPIVMFERSISIPDQVKCSSTSSTRPIVYQSSNCNLRQRKEDLVEVPKPVEKLKETNCNNIVDHETNSGSWDKLLNDRNHVNTLIDEMFASVLNVPGIEDDPLETPENIPVAPSSPPPLPPPANDVTVNNINTSNGKDESSSLSFTSSDKLSLNSSSNDEENISTTIIVINEEPVSNCLDGKMCGVGEDETISQVKVHFDDQMNHELLISELENMMKDQEKILKRQRKPSMNLYCDNGECVEVNDGEKDVHKRSSCQIAIEDVGSVGVNNNNNRLNKMSSLHGLPPLPKSLSGFNLLESPDTPPTPIRTNSARSNHLVYPSHPKNTTTVNGATVPSDTPTTTGRKSTNLDAQLDILRREMYSLRQLDLSLLSQLWSLNESIQDFRQILQDQDDRVLSPPSPSPTPSSGDEGEGADDFYMMSTSSISFRPAPPPPPAVAPRRLSSSSNASSSIHEER